MQDEINEKTIALYIKTGKLTAQTLQKAMKTLLAQMKKQKDKTPQGKQTLKQLMKQNAGVSTRAFPTLRLPRAISKPLRVRRKSTVSTLR